MGLLYDWKDWRILANTNNPCHKEKKWFSKYYPIMQSTWFSKCFIYYLLFYLFIRVNKYSRTSCQIKKNHWSIGEIHLRIKDIYIPLASILTSCLLKG